MKKEETILDWCMYYFTYFIMLFYILGIGTGGYIYHKMKRKS